MKMNPKVAVDILQNMKIHIFKSMKDPVMRNKYLEALNVGIKTITLKNEVILDFDDDLETHKTKYYIELRSK